MGHFIQECLEFLEMIQEMMDGGKIEFCGKTKEQNVSVLLEEVRKPLTVFYRGGGQQAAKETSQAPTPKLVIKVPTPFRYTSDKAVPRNYTSQTVTPVPQAVVEQKPEKSVNDVTGTGGMTRSERCYAPDTSGAKEMETSLDNEGIKIAASKKKDKEPINKSVTEMEADEFLKFIKHSEYSIVEQLHKLPAKISLLALMLNSEPHREAVLKILKQAYVPHNVSVDKIDRLVGNVMMDNYVSFSDDEIPPDGHGSTKALHITTKVKDCTLPKVLIDNGSSLNVMPLSTLMRLPVDRSYMKHSKINSKSL